MRESQHVMTDSTSKHLFTLDLYSHPSAVSCDESWQVVISAPLHALHKQLRANNAPAYTANVWDGWNPSLSKDCPIFEQPCNCEQHICRTLQPKGLCQLLQDVQQQLTKTFRSKCPANKLSTVAWSLKQITVHQLCTTVSFYCIAESFIHWHSLMHNPFFGEGDCRTADTSAITSKPLLACTN